MLIFDEKAYAKELLKEKTFKTYRQKDIERYVLIRYLHSQGLSFDEIENKLQKFPLVGCEYLDKKEIDMIYSKIIDKALSCDLITGIKVDIFKSEMEVINSVKNEHARNLLFILLVYYKWAINQSYLYFYSKHNEAKMVMTNDIDCWKLAGLMKLRVADRYKLCNELISNKLYVEDNFKSHNYFYLPFSKDSGDIAISIDNYDNIIGELYYYNEPEKYKRCATCGTVIQKTRSPKKYCSKCAYEAKRAYDKKKRKNRKPANRCK